VKLADFGLSRTITLPIRNLTLECCTLWYRPPEMLLGSKEYSINIDIWPIGCIFAELLNQGQSIFRGDCCYGQLIEIFKVLGTPSNETWDKVSHLDNFSFKFPKFVGMGLKKAIDQAVSPEGIEMLNRLLELNPFERISCKNALKDEYFSY